MGSPVVKELYQNVIIETIKSIKNEFLNEGLDDHVLFELQSLWEGKLAQHGISVFDNQEEEDEEYEDDEEEGDDELNDLDDVHAVQFGNQAEYPSKMEAKQNYNNGQGNPPQYNYPPPPGNIGRPQQYMPPHEQNGYYNPRIPQNDGACDVSLEDEMMSKLVSKMEGSCVGNCKGKETADLESNNDSKLLTTTTQTKCRAAVVEFSEGKLNIIQQNDGGNDEDLDDEDLGSDLDEDDDDEDADYDDIILCQFDKVTRTKSRWKTNLKDGVMRLNDRDYVFRKGVGEFEF
eukprot:Nk52_evm7s2209 gene=Nk52_evmTU7s2209